MLGLLHREITKVIPVAALEIHSNKSLHETFFLLSMKLNSSSSSLKYFAVVLLMVEETVLAIKTILQDHELEKHFNICSLTFM